MFNMKVILGFLAIFIFTAVGAAISAPTEVIMQWDSVTEADGYKIYWGSASRGYNGVGVDSNGDLISSPYTISGVNNTKGAIFIEPGPYYFAVTAFNNYGESGYSEELAASILGKLAPEPAVTSAHVDGNTVTISWTHAENIPVNEFRVILSGLVPATVGSTVRSYTYTDVPEGHHLVTVYSVNEVDAIRSNDIAINIDPVVIIPPLEIPVGFTGIICDEYDNGRLIKTIIE